MMAFVFEILLGILVITIAWCCIHRLQEHGKPGFKTWPLLGATLDVSANYSRIYDWILWNLREKSATTVTFPMPTYSYVFTVNPANVEHILKTNFSNYPKGNWFHEKFEPLLGNGIFNSDGEVWKTQRKTASFEFASKVLREFSTDLFKEYAFKLAKMVGDAAGTGNSLDIQDLFMRMTLDSICRFGFGVELGTLSPTLPENGFATAFDQCNATISYRFADPFWKFKSLFRIGQEGALKNYIKTVDSFTHDIIRKRRIQLQASGDGQHHVKQDILSRFMSLDQNISNTNLRDIILNFVIAGRDTTASTLSWFIYMIASHSESATKIHKELLEFQQTQQPIDKHLWQSMQSFSELLTYESLSKLPYLHASITETLRLYPAVPLNFKSASQADIFPDGTPVTRGDIVAYAPYCMGRLESLWGSDAHEFRPERWYTKGAWDFNVSPFKFTAFQAGPRICLGKDSAYLQMKITAAILCRFFAFDLVPDQTVTYRVMATMSIANGLKVTSKLRPELHCNPIQI